MTIKSINSKNRINHKSPFSRIRNNKQGIIPFWTRTQGFVEIRDELLRIEGVRRGVVVVLDPTQYFAGGVVRLDEGEVGKSSFFGVLLEIIYL